MAQGAGESITVNVCKCGAIFTDDFNSKYCPAGHAYDYERMTLVPEARLKTTQEALQPFANLAATADEFGHKSGSTCLWRIKYDHLQAARAALADA